MSFQLLADVGGTRTRFALLRNGRVGPIESMPTGAYASMHDAARHFRNGQAEGIVVDRAVVAAAGPVSGGIANSPMRRGSWRRPPLQDGAAGR